jgi:hypothetical protein
VRFPERKLTEWQSGKESLSLPSRVQKDVMPGATAAIIGMFQVFGVIDRKQIDDVYMA